MNITEYKLTITGSINKTEITKELIYRGNENIIINSTCGMINEGEEIKFQVLIPRHILTKFLEILE